MIRTQRTLIALVIGGIAGVLLAQRADSNAAGPTKNDYRLRVLEPKEGSVVAGSSLQVTVDTNVPADVGSERKDSASMPNPRVALYVDNVQKGMLTETQNTMTIDNVVPGDHKLVVVAMNKANEIIDRKVVNFSTTAASSASTTSTASTASTTGYQPKTATAPSAPPPSSSSSSPVYSAPPPVSSSDSSTLPKTGTSNALELGAGLTLIAGGLLLRRRSL